MIYCDKTVYFTRLYLTTINDFVLWRAINKTRRNNSMMPSVSHKIVRAYPFGSITGISGTVQIMIGLPCPF